MSQNVEFNKQTTSGAKGMERGGRTGIGVGERGSIEDSRGSRASFWSAQSSFGTIIDPVRKEPNKFFLQMDNISGMLQGRGWIVSGWGKQ